MPSFEHLAPQLREWLPRQRWFQGKDRAIDDVRVADHAMADTGLALLIVDVTSGGRASDRYLVPISPAADGELTVDGRSWGDALADPDAARLLADLACQKSHVECASGAVIEGAPVTGERPEPGARVRRLRAEQSNTSVILGETWILKALRRLEAGVHPDIELTAALTAEGFPNVPAQHGSLHLVGGHQRTALAVLSEFIAGGREGWGLATADTARGQTDLLDTLPALGEAVAAMHRTLGDALGTRPAEPDEPRRWADAMAAQLDRVLEASQRLAPEATAPLRARAGEVAALFSRVAELREVGPLVRIHGDLHLGQVLLAPDGRWVLLDFEGEPIKTLSERRVMGSPLRDVAGMLRSFDYAAAEPHAGDIPARAADWRDRARRAFLDGYLSGAAGVLPDPDVAEALLAAWELDKAVYELGYELANRPDWVPIPTRGIVRLLESG